MFAVYKTQDVINLLKTFVFTRKLTQFHIHHTWSPSYKDFTGKNYQELQQGMKDYHMKTNGWADIGQHFTLCPDGIWIAGRDLNRDPASILGWNTGSIAVEMIGNFDVDKDSMSKEQKEAILEVTEYVVEQMSLIPHFHRDNPTAGKTCPGSGINRDVFFQEFANFTENKLLAQQQVLAEQEKAKSLAESQAKADKIKQVLSTLDVRFTDMLNNETMQPHWANKYVNFLNDKRIVKGIQQEDGTTKFEPDRPITRAEAATLIAKTYESIIEQIHTALSSIK